MDSSISASVVLYKNKPETVSRLLSSYVNSPGTGRLYVIDNSPTDILRGTCRHPKVVYRFNNFNLGYGSAHNLALRSSVEGSTYHLVMNPDVYFDPSVPGKLKQFMDQSPEVGLCMPRVRYPDGRLQPLCKLLPGPKQLISRRFLPFLPRFLQKINYEYEMHFTRYDHVTEVPFLSGCFMFLRTEALKKVGFFDESYFLYAEDADLSRKIGKEYKNMYFPGAEIFHEHGRGSYKNFSLLLHNISSVVKYFNKWGWIHDEDRKSINRRILIKYRVNGYASKSQ